MADEVKEKEQTKSSIRSVRSLRRSPEPVEFSEGDTLQLDRTWIHNGVRFGPGSYTVVEDDETNPVQQQEADNDLVIPMSAAVDIAGKIESAKARDAARAERLMGTAAQILPDDFPYKAQLELAGVEFLSDLDGWDKRRLTTIPGIGKPEAEEILEFHANLASMEAPHGKVRLPDSRSKRKSGKSRR